MRLRGITLADWTADGYASASAREAIEDIAATGANTVVLIRTAYQRTLSSSRVDVDGRTPTIASLETIASWARERGLAVVVKPHVDVDTGEWRGAISPDNVDLWFDSYEEFVDETARLAERIGAVTFVVGTELAGTVERGRRWRELIASVRAVYDGQLTYAASWDGAGRVGFWDALDAVGVDFYGSVTMRDDPGRVEILVGWQPWLERLRRLQHRTSKRIVLTEIGYRSVDGAGGTPFALGEVGAVDTREQADLYWAALEALGTVDWLEGVCWWNWLASGEGGMTNDDYTPKGKPAESELTDAWR
jgi:hypothetical protein